MPTEGTTQSKVLIVDDIADNRALARATLEDENYEVILAASGREGIEAFEKTQPDCVVLDIRMPDLDGFKVCQRIRTLPKGAEVPILFLTALRDIDAFDSALQAGADDFLTKPVRPAELVVRVQAALKLRKMGAELREYYDLARRQRDDMMRLQLQKERLTSFVVHDLKNPINSLDLHAQVLLRNPELPVRARESVQHIRDEARALLRLILNLLDISKSEEGQLAPQLSEINLDSFISEVFASLELRAKTAGVVLVHTLAVHTLRADTDLLRRVLENLLDNAIRYAPRDTQIRLTAHTVGHDVDIRIADAGPGIASEMRDKIFDRYVQLETGIRLAKRTGRGLGLAFCKLAMQAHGGDIWIEDGHPGTVFCLKFKAAL